MDLIFVNVHARHARIRAAAGRFLIVSAVQIFRYFQQLMRILYSATLGQDSLASYSYLPMQHKALASSLIENVQILFWHILDQRPIPYAALD
jgi:hypothetical protein